MAETTTSASASGPKDRSQELAPWYTETLTSVPDNVRKVLETYSHVPAEEVESHILSLRERAWSICPYPCIGQFRFLDLSISIHPYYPNVISRLLPSSTPGVPSTRDPANFLDLGCCLGQDFRALAAAGVPVSQLHGAELEPAFIDLGFDLFRDRDRVPASRFVTPADIFAESFFDTPEPGKDASGGRGVFAPLLGKMDVIYAASFFHLFDWEGQLEIARRVIKLMRPVPGSVVLGRQAGNLQAGSQESRMNEWLNVFKKNEPGKEESKESGNNPVNDEDRDSTTTTETKNQSYKPTNKNRSSAPYRHNPESWQNLWSEIGRETGTEWEVHSELIESSARRWNMAKPSGEGRVDASASGAPNEDKSWLDQGVRMMWFWVIRK
ncbi:MAG: hypothetical protein M4579_006512 [Chaenotheca gracillima]|nr:MAG: hypothetical protein M4579_006512 [Chaenotheca gracillima]